MGSRTLSILMGGLVLSFLIVGLVQAAEYSAVTVSKNSGHEIQGKVFVKGEKERVEISSPKTAGVIILRRDKKVMWMLQPGQKSYTEMPLVQKDMANSFYFPGEGVTKKLLGTETLNGYEAEKYEGTHVEDNGREEKFIMWISKKSRIPLRIESPDKSFTLDYKDIKEGGVDDALFEMPVGYQKMNNPAGKPKMK
jgi:outer membrane lipoprotein-sorting protein